ncbi:hypothetical protein QYE76_002660 [Lolium multiflorum]|uniref:Uncharacterized protein n=1 Tax=Lolium multiflorum TaxID=4521 RepID=A0AAD8RNY7_LOLMU|nr:hypothetical protein QYE76_002660 [Lolium multiflorum]
MSLFAGELVPDSSLVGLLLLDQSCRRAVGNTDHDDSGLTGVLYPVILFAQAAGPECIMPSQQAPLRLMRIKVINDTVWLANIAPNISRKTLQDVQFKGLDILDILGHLSRENMLQEDAGVFSRMM